MKQNLKTKLIALVLTLALAITGVSFGDVMTAQAAIDYGIYQVDNIRDVENTTITMKIGDEKRLNIMMKGYACDETNDYIWESSDESIVKMNRNYALDENSECAKVSDVSLIGLKSGTAVITAKRPSGSEIVSVTVKVTKPKVTAKQKKCKHKFKVTKKATCLRYGMKTCKKCKLQKLVPQKKHEFKTVTVNSYEIKTRMVLICGGCTCDNHQHEGGVSNACSNACKETFDPRDYGSEDAAWNARSKHQSECRHETSGNWHFYEVPTGVTEPVQKEISKCKSCNNSKNYLDLINTPNNPEKTLWINIRTNESWKDQL